MTATRLSQDRAPGHSVDRGREVSFTVDGQAVSGFSGDTVASALLGSGRIQCGPSIYRGRPRGILTAGVEEPNALIHVTGGGPGDPAEGMLTATTLPATEGHELQWLSGIGRLDPEPDGARYDHRHTHTDVLVVGAGPAGLTAAREAARTGARVMLLDDDTEPGGSLLCERDPGPRRWAQETAEFIDAQPEARYLPRTTALGSHDANYIVAVQHCAEDPTRSPSSSGPRQRVWHIRARRVVLATGAHERPIVFADNDRPGIMLASAVRTYLNRYGVAAGQSPVITTTNDAAYDTLEDLHAAGVGVVAVVDSRPQATPRAEQALQRTGVEGIFGSAICGTTADENGELNGVTVSALSAEGELSGETRELSTDLLAVSGGHSPVVHLHSQRQGRLQWDESAAAFLPEEPIRDQFLAGAVTGSRSLARSLAEGATAGAQAAAETGAASRSGESSENSVPDEQEIFSTDVPGNRAEPAAVRPLWLVPSASGVPAEWSTHFVDLQRDEPVSDVVRALGAGMHSVEHVKRYTSISTGNDQGKTSAVNAIGVIRQMLSGSDHSDIGTTTFRAPYSPVSFAALAGRRRGRLFDPARITPIHSWHVDHGAVFEDVGQWKRPRYYPQAGETMDDAVLRECAAARTDVGIQDVSTLGKILLRGSDVPEFLNRVYTNGFAKLRVGAARYGMMCTLDGMVFDDGVCFRLAEDEYFMTTTTGGAARVLDWLEEWHQTEWPELDVAMTSVTEQYSTVAVVGPRSRELVGRVAPELDVSQENLGFMRFASTTLANGTTARVARVSFSGELAFEITVDGGYGLGLWELIWEAGQGLGVTPYGTETMHVLRAEKGLLIVGQDTDGTVTPQDAGMEWIVSPHKDFLGKRSYSRVDTSREDRKHLVGVLPVDGATRLEEGAQLIERELEPDEIGPGKPIVPAFGHVTSSYLSAALGRPFGLAMLKDGRRRIGEIMHSPVPGGSIAVEITSHVLFDPEGERRDGVVPEGEPGTTPSAAGPTSTVSSAGGSSVTGSSAGGSSAGGSASRAPSQAGQSADQQRIAPADELRDRMEALSRESGHAAELREIRFPEHIGLRCTPGTDAAEALERVLGLSLPSSPLTSTGDLGGAHILWLSPDEFLYVDVTGEHVSSDALSTALEGLGGQAVDLSSNRATLELSGAGARDVLESGCRIDLHPREFPVGMVVSTLLSTVNVIIHRSGEDVFRIMPRSSFAHYTVEWLLDAMAGHAPEHAPATR